jgi:hypothetical protein
VQEFYGASKTREIYEKAIAVLPDTSVRDMCLKYASMEQKLGEIDRYNYRVQIVSDILSL